MSIAFPNTYCVLLLLVAGLIAPQPGTARAQSVWELTPYQVRVVIAATHVPELGSVPQQLVHELAPRMENLLGAAWQIEVIADGGPPSEAHAAVWALPAGAIDAARLPEGWLTPDHDKLLLLRVVPAVDGWRVAAREWDAATSRLGPVVTHPLRQAAKLRDTAVRALLDAFRPLSRIERVEAGEGGWRAVLRLRAGGLPTRDPELQWALAGKLFCPIVRFNDREGRLRRDRDGNPLLPQPVPWTFLVVEDVDGSEAVCRIQSGLGAPLSAGRRGRTEQLALAVLPPAEATRLTLLARDEPHRPLAGYEVLVQRPGETATRLVGRTDRSGGIELAPADDPLTIVLIRSGRQLLARLPVVAGFATELAAYVPDDTQRLEAEAFVSALQEQLVDTVTRREVLLRRAETELEAGRTEEVKRLLTRLQQLPDRETLRRRLLTRRSRLRSPDRHVQRQLETLFDDTSKLLDRHLDPAPVNALAQAVAHQAAGTSAAP